MECSLQAKVKAMTMQLAREEQARLRAAGAWVELEELACEIGDEFTRQLMSLEMGDRCTEAAEETTSTCPDCGGAGGQREAKPRSVTSLRGEVRYHEPTYYCPACRRSFFPGGGSDGAARASQCDAEVVAEDGVVRRQPKQL